MVYKFRVEKGLGFRVEKAEIRCKRRLEAIAHRVSMRADGQTDR